MTAGSTAAESGRREPDFVLDSSYRRPARGRVVIAGSPLRIFRLSPAGERIAEALERGAPLPPGHARLTDRLVDAGAIHPLVGTAAARSLADLVTVVVPAFGEQPEIATGGITTILVDDGSEPPLTTGGATRLVRFAANQGPGAARNAGLAEVTTPFVAFIDCDVQLDESVLAGLLAHLDDPRVALVAPRITATPGTTALARFEAGRSPLDMGTEPARVAAATRVSYVPAAVIMCRTDAVREVGGFDESLRYGEDVDLVWRLGEAGWRCRYEPAVVATHRTRRTLRDWVLQRVRYGTSAAPLSRKHPGALAPVRMSGWSAATWGAAAAGAPLMAAGIGLSTTIALTKKLRDIPPAESLRLAGLGHLYAGTLLSSVMVRAWWPIAATVASISPRARRLLIAGATVPAAVDWWRTRPEIDPVRYIGLRILDDVAYGTGVWLGAIRERTADPLLPVLTSWPGRTSSATSASKPVPTPASGT